ncbi:MAG: DinB family protein [Bacteroidetes bacterium]|nr:DinB family protein [Bacteroidota bacterium]
MLHPEKLSLLKRTHNAVQEFAQSIPENLRTVKPDAVAFSANEIIHHLRDVEKLWHERFEEMRKKKDVIFEPMDPDRTAHDGQYNTKHMHDALQQWGELRERTLDVVESMEDEELDIEAEHPRYGKMDVRRILDVMANHDMQHLEQLKRTVDTVSNKKK